MGTTTLVSYQRTVRIDFRKGIVHWELEAHTRTGRTCSFWDPLSRPSLSRFLSLIISELDKRAILSSNLRERALLTRGAFEVAFCGPGWGSIRFGKSRMGRGLKMRIRGRVRPTLHILGILDWNGERTEREGRCLVIREIGRRGRHDSLDSLLYIGEFLLFFCTLDQSGLVTLLVDLESCDGSCTEGPSSAALLSLRSRLGPFRHFRSDSYLSRPKQMVKCSNQVGREQDPANDVVTFFGNCRARFRRRAAECSDFSCSAQDLVFIWLWKQAQPGQVGAKEGP